MAEMTKEEAKKDLEGLKSKKQADIDKGKKENMSPKEKEADDLAAKQAKEKQDAAVKQANRDQEIIGASEEDLKDPKKFSEADKTRRVELLAKKEKDVEEKRSPEEKIAHIKQETQKRIDVISGKLKAFEATSTKKTNAMERQIVTLQDEKKALEEKLTQPAKPEDDVEGVLDKEEQDRLAKYLKEDEGLPKEKRREMSKEELDAWIAEDFASANDWMIIRRNRRDKERFVGKSDKQFKKNLKNLMDKQEESKKRAFANHPELDTSKREEELKVDGKKPQEIHEILCKEIPNHKIVKGLLMQNPQRYVNAENGPELLVQDLEERLSAGPADDPNKELKDQVATLTKQVETLTTELQKRDLIDEDAINSDNQPPKIAAGELTEAEKQYAKTAKDTGVPQDRIDARLKTMRAARGAK